MKRRKRKRSIGRVGGNCRGIRWRCPTKDDCYANPRRDVLLRVECYDDGKCLGEAVFGKRRPIAERARFKSMNDAKDWACSVGKRKRYF